MMKALIFGVMMVGASHVSLATDYLEVAKAINVTMRSYHYAPAELDSASYRQVEAAVVELADTSSTDAEFVSGFREIWKNGPFSHVELRATQQSAAELASYLDTLRIGGGGATLSWHDDIAILTVNTMMGLDTIEQIDASYVAITEQNTKALVIDLRANEGGAFAVRPLLAHLFSAPVAGGSFVAQRWTADHDRPPSNEELQSFAPWTGWSIRSFWNDVQNDGVIRLIIEPQTPIFSGPVYILTSARTASAAELATEILHNTGRATVIGEKTAGQLLSQKIYDIPGGFHLSLPIADYYAASEKRIEGVGIHPDIESEAVDALNAALAEIGADRAP
jgi:carboxyl-terminal processing protease